MNNKKVLVTTIIIDISTGMFRTDDCGWVQTVVPVADGAGITPVGLYLARLISRCFVFYMIYSASL